MNAALNDGMMGLQNRPTFPILGDIAKKMLIGCSLLDLSRCGLGMVELNPIALVCSAAARTRHRRANIMPCKQGLNVPHDLLVKRYCAHTETRC